MYVVRMDTVLDIYLVSTQRLHNPVACILSVYVRHTFHWTARQLNNQSINKFLGWPK